MSFSNIFAPFFAIFAKLDTKPFLFRNKTAAPAKQIDKKSLDLWLYALKTGRNRETRKSFTAIKNMVENAQ